MGKKMNVVASHLRRHKYLWTTLVFLLIIGVLDENSLISRYQLHARNEATRAEIRKYEEQYLRDQRDLQEMQNSPDAVERVARMDLLMKTPDEDVYVIE